MIYKIICAQPIKGIERSLPYEFEDEGYAIKIAEELDGMMEYLGHGLYQHRVVEGQPAPQKVARKVGRKSGR